MKKWACINQKYIIKLQKSKFDQIHYERKTCGGGFSLMNHPVYIKLIILFI